MSKYVLLAVTLLASSASAVSDESLVKDAIVATLKEAIAAESESQSQGVENCLNKCKNVFDNTQYAIQTTGPSTYEYTACAVGCQVCEQQIQKKDKDSGSCFKTCKDTDWLQMKDDQGNAVVVQKGVIEADKACQMGCVIQTCQVVCTGGTTDMKQTSANKNLWWPLPNGCPGNKGATCGCSMKTGGVRPGGYYTQNSEYNYWNSGQAGEGGAAECCSNAVTVCQYAGSKNSANYKNAVKQMQNYCKDVPGIGGTSVGAMCGWASAPGNCGTPI
jgi:hypothetical protein